MISRCDVPRTCNDLVIEGIHKPFIKNNGAERKPRTDNKKNPPEGNIFFHFYNIQ